MVKRWCGPVAAHEHSMWKVLRGLFGGREREPPAAEGELTLAQVWPAFPPEAPPGRFYPGYDKRCARDTIPNK
jgi:hypothetical protein